MCSHPVCVEKMISAMQHNGRCGGLIKFCRKLDKDRNENEFGTYIVMTLLEGARKGKPTVLNSFHMRWASLNYLTKLRKDEIKAVKHKEIIAQIDTLLQFEVEEMVQNIGLGIFSTGRSRNIEQTNPEKACAHKEIVEMTISEWGVETYLWLYKELTDLDYCKITGKTPKELQTIRNQWSSWYRRITNECSV